MITEDILLDETKLRAYVDAELKRSTIEKFLGYFVETSVDVLMNGYDGADSGRIAAEFKRYWDVEIARELIDVELSNLRSRPRMRGILQ